MIVEAVERWKPENGSLILSARPGAGKTAACVAKLCQLRAQAEKAFDPRLLPSFLFTTAAQLSGARRQQRFGTGESYLVDQAMQRDLLVLDEIGFEPIDGVSFEVIDTRYRKQRPTLVTTGLAPAEFAQRYGSAVWRRLTESGAVVEDHGTKQLKVAR
ncbi:MAG TPA: ATP-binding protein [Polyangiaceae bacterium]